MKTCTNGCAHTSISITPEATLILILRAINKSTLVFPLPGEAHIYINILYNPVLLCKTLVLGKAGITCEGHFPEQVLDLWCNAQFVKVQAEKTYRIL